MINVYAINIFSCKLNEIQYNNLLSCLQLDKQERIRRFHHRDDAIRTLIADLLVRSIISSELGIENQDVKFDKNEYGKPYLRSHQHFNFNISHSGKWVVCATSSYPIGVDIEYIKPIDFDIARRFFSYDEYRQLDMCNREQRLSFFYDLWTLKESYIKAIRKRVICFTKFFFISN
ncbi:4'-phosphopantetheinyl transferase family protein [Paenibacillus glucanolyticus]|uniref:4'-phosphopantetheinyl transferase family protein n=1 Tax=Paenibacillus glucanolyticus TaxID=59843 RepID=UPI003685FED3